VAPAIAVVIPSRRGPRLAFLLDALAEQTLASERFEVIVVRDRRSAGPAPAMPAPLRGQVLVAGSECGPTVKRNLGWRASGASVVAFTDDDCRPAPDWLERLVEATGPERIVQGRTEPDPDERHLLHGLARSQAITGPSEWFQACNIAYPRALLERLGGFDEAFAFGGEDTDLGLRARAAGAELTYVDRAVVWHAVIPRPLPGALREAWRWPSQPLVVKRHPQQRGAIFARTFWKRSHATLPLAVAGLTLTGRSRGLSLALVLPYAREALPPGGVTPRRLVRVALTLAARALLDGAEIAATARAAIRHRVAVI
jgi:cellulose synthase/poly-beta-1,6-N-acetylglucosamine synthase-like glycosyltransferase